MGFERELLRAAPALAGAAPLFARARPAHHQRAFLADPHRSPHDPAGWLRRQPQGATRLGALPPPQHALSGAPAAAGVGARGRSTSCCARICTRITLAGTRYCATAAGCRPFPTRSTCCRAPRAKSGTRAQSRGRADPRRSVAYADSVLPVIEAGQVVLVDGAHAIDDRMLVEPAPGHTPGHVILKLATGRAGVLRRRDSPPAADLHAAVESGFCGLPEQARTTRRRMLEHCVESGALLFPRISARRTSRRSSTPATRSRCASSTANRCEAPCGSNSTVMDCDERPFEHIAQRPPRSSNGPVFAQCAELDGVERSLNATKTTTISPTVHANRMATNRTRKSIAPAQALDLPEIFRNVIVQRLDSFRDEGDLLELPPGQFGPRSNPLLQSLALAEK